MPSQARIEKITLPLGGSDCYSFSRKINSQFEFIKMKNYILSERPQRRHCLAPPASTTTAFQLIAANRHGSGM